MNTLRNLAITRQNLKHNIPPIDNANIIDNNRDTKIPMPEQTTERVKAAFVVLVRNRELDDLRSSMRDMEATFNYKYNYPWIFLNEEPFTEEFISLTTAMTKANVSYGLVKEEHWSYPPWIDQNLARKKREQMAALGVIYGGSESYRHMCRFQSGFFYMHPLLDDLDYYWRVEPDVNFMCDIDYDPFLYMKQHDKKYGFTISLKEFYSTVPTLWKTSREWMNLNQKYLVPGDHPENLMKFVTDDNGESYNLCHFWSNFEIGSVAFLRSEAYQSYFRYLDQAGGFFYERWGDAPVHSIAVAMLLKASEVHFFNDMGYRHGPFQHCPDGPDWLSKGKCYCEPRKSFDLSFNSCLSKWMQVTNTTRDGYIISQK
ncbi:nucleotide-diphospho-sugar transferase [Umbelopsis sp. PMI_123]|nr:nucleotide-diphospho-sugar transferase [Umbelopsis sp. PMI_123]